ncbi:MAG: DUF5105 domain-containing protein [Lactobacillales bacterium]|jgi:hypothetical protein|nr:DUF5105 domain-containing protein [Lactobacillales bacterium]
MKKKLGLLSSLIVLVIMMAGCAGNKKSKDEISAKQAAREYIDYVVYNKEAKDFDKHFENPKKLKELSDSTTVYIEGYKRTFNGFVPEMTEDEGNKIIESVKKQLAEKTKYEIVSVKEDEKEHKSTVTFKLTGLNEEDAVKTGLTNWKNAILQDIEITTDRAKMNGILKDELTKTYENLSTIESNKQEKVVFTNMAGKWVIEIDQSEPMDNVISTLVQGEPTKELSTSLTKENDAAVAEINKAVADYNAQQ